jgi:RHH-type proline utilization regulon transcriptional repressor/proline dehydrogenase/delta 1-pyrroline-5-carboxylate dehydrogenase
MSAPGEFVFPQRVFAPSALRAAITERWCADEERVIEALLPLAALPPERAAAVSAEAAGWIREVRAQPQSGSMLDAFLREYGLSSQEGVLLMCLAEALLRIPDAETAERLIADKLGSADWARHLGQSDSLLVNASTWGLLLTGRLLRFGTLAGEGVDAWLGRLLSRSGEPLIRLALRQAMRLMGEQFVLGESIGQAWTRAVDARAGERYSFDMLGEAALCRDDAERDFQRYRHAIAVLGAASAPTANDPVEARPGISVKLSALHPRYEEFQRERVLRELRPRLLQLAVAARAQNLGLTVDAEEADRLELSLDLVESVYADHALAGWSGFGLAVQAVQKRAPAVIDWLVHLAAGVGRRLAVRLVKGAYWDTEIQLAQERGLSGYPVYTRKAATDVAYLACARKLLDAGANCYPMFATHNAHTMAAVQAMGQGHPDWEFQRLHGMGEALYGVLRARLPRPCRVYAPVGSHAALLPYLVRRLLENGANTSFVHRIFDEEASPEALAADPIQTWRAARSSRSRIAAPDALFGDRRNSRGLALTDRNEQRDLQARLHGVAQTATDRAGKSGLEVVRDPADRRRITGYWQPAGQEAIDAAMAGARQVQPDWDAQTVESRTVLLERAAELLEARPADFLHLLIREAGKTVPDAVAEVRETVDFLRYYAQQARRLMASTQTLPGPAGERNELRLRGRGIFACISPWNFPLAIFTGQIAAALVCGNAVVAKPAEQTPLIALRMGRLLGDAGLPPQILQILPGDGAFGAALVAHESLNGVAFTGSLAVARSIAATLAARKGALAGLIAETGGQNAMIADSSALPEQLVRDALRSAFGSAGQRCSALRVLYLQQEIAERVIGLLRGAMRELRIGDPGQLATDVGPVIDETARVALCAHIEELRRHNQLIESVPLTADCAHGHFVAPSLAEIPRIDCLQSEHFGPILHIVRYPASELDAVGEAINATGYGLTLGIHSRIESTWERIARQARAGNVYVNRSMTGAVVGSQPFGGEGLSGTGPKAGGPHYLPRFVSEQTLCVNTAAMGGNASLLAGED